MDFFLLFLFLFFIFSVLLSIESVCMHMIIWCASVCVVHIIMCDAQTSTGRMHHGDKQQLYSWNWKTCSHMQILWPNQTRHRKKKNKKKPSHRIELLWFFLLLFVALEKQTRRVHCHWLGRWRTTTFAFTEYMFISTNFLFSTRKYKYRLHLWQIIYPGPIVLCA